MEKKDFKILIVDDEFITIEPIWRYLLSVGFPVEYAISGEEALQKTTRSSYALFIIDIQMPGINGMELLDQLDLKSKHAEAILVTGHETLETAKQAVLLGAYCYLCKPVALALMVGKIFELLQLKLEKQQYLHSLEEQVKSRTKQYENEKNRCLQAEESMRRSEERYRRITAGITDYLYSVFIEGGVVVSTRHNPACVSVTGYTEEEFSADPFLWINIVPAEEREEVKKHVGEILAGAVIPSIEHRIIRKDGEIRWVSDTAILNKDTNGKLVSYDGVIKDITDRKRDEERIRAQIDELAHVTRVATMGELTSSLAHEINQPLTAILSNAQAALRFMNAARPDLTEVGGALTDIVSDCRRAGKVVHEIRALMKKEEPRRELLDIRRIFEEVLVLTNSDSIIKNVKIIRDVPGDLPYVYCNRVQMQQVMINLIVNGCEAMKDVAAEEKTLTIRSVTNNSENLVVEIEDRGHGITEEAREKIFEPFFTTRPEGLGMGLSIAKSIVEAHGGKLLVRNNPDKGATFIFSLPVQGVKT
jgi:PAS domain S-box-containing protein